VPTVSVVVTCYNLGQYLDEAVDSVLAQTFQDLELLIVDDGSTDPATQSVLANYVRPKTRVIRASHVGIAAARNTGLEHATGQYLCVLDADDRLLPTFLERTVGMLARDSTLTFCGTWLKTFGDEQWEWTPRHCDLPTLLWEDTVLTAAPVRRDAVVAIGGFDTKMPEQGDDDWHLWLSLVAAGYRGTILPEVLYEYRRRPNSVSHHCWYGAGHLPLLRYRVHKYRDLYLKNLWEVLLHQDEATGALLRRNDELERHLASNLEPALVAREAELLALEARLAQLDAAAMHVSSLESALAASTAEVAAFRQSMSWRVTGPLRAMYDWWLKWTGA